MTRRFTHVSTDEALSMPSFSQGVCAERLIWLSGQVGLDTVSGAQPEDFADEVARALDNMTAVLRQAGVDRTSVVKTSCYLSDMAYFAEYDAVYRQYFEEPRPARTTVGAALAGSLRFEIEAVAVTR